MLRSSLVRLLRQIATFSVLVTVASCSCGWRYHVRGPSGEPLTSTAEDFATRSLAGGRIEYGIDARWVNLRGFVESFIANRASTPLRVRVDRARFVTASGLALAATSSESPAPPRQAATTLRGTAATRREPSDSSQLAHVEAIEVAPGAEVRITRTFGPMEPYRGCSPDPALGSVVFVEDGLELDGEPIEATFELQRRRK